jgi:hypothetical protein
VRPPRLLVPAAAAALTLATAAVAAGMRAPVEDGTLSVRDGRVTIVLKLRGGVIGRFGRGKLTVTDLNPDSGTVVVHGAERERLVNERKTIYAGSNIRFRISDDRRVVVRIAGTKINLSAVGRGDGSMDGYGDQEGVFFDGSFSLNGSPYRSIPDERFQFDLVASPSG